MILDQVELTGAAHEPASISPFDRGRIARAQRGNDVAVLVVVIAVALVLALVCK